MTTTRRENLGVVNNSRIANRYAIPASVKEPMKYGPPRSLKYREQIVTAVHNAAPSVYTLHAGVTEPFLGVRPRLIPRKLPLFKPRRRARRSCRSQPQLLCQPGQVVNHINIVKRICETY